MRSKPSCFFWIVMLLTTCQPKGKNEVAGILGIPEPKEWILVIHPEGCKTCLDSFYEKLKTLPKDSPGAIIILAKNSKTLRMNPLIQASPIPIYLDEQKQLIQKGLVQMTDQILLFRGKGCTSFDILDYEHALIELKRIP